MTVSKDRPKVVVIGDPDRDNWSSARTPLDDAGVDLVVVRVGSVDELVRQAPDTAGLVQAGMRFDRSLYERLPQLKAIGAMGIGVDTIDVAAATERGIIVFNLPGLIHRDVAVHAMMFVLALARQLVPFHLAMKTAQRPQQLNPIPHLHESTLGLIAFGSIAREVTKIAQAIGMNVIAYDPIVDADAMTRAGVTKVTLDDLFRQSDFVSSHVPLSEETFHLVGAHHFNLMKPTAYFINTGRGKTVDEPALIQALRDKKLAGAGLDVLEQEPASPENPLLSMDNVLLTPHSASQSVNTREERKVRICQEMARIFTGHWPVQGLVNRELRNRLQLAD